MAKNIINYQLLDQIRLLRERERERGSFHVI